MRRSASSLAPYTVNNIAVAALIAAAGKNLVDHAAAIAEITAQVKPFYGRCPWLSV
jgi:hypothetical protein